MISSATARATTRRVPAILVAGLLVVTSACAATLGYQALVSSASTATSPVDLLRSENRGATAPPIDGLPSAHRGALGEADGAVPDGSMVFADDLPAIRVLGL